MSSDPNDEVLSIIAGIKDCQQTATDSTELRKQTGIKATNKVTKSSLRGVPKSGRFWKSPKEKFSTINKTKGLRQDFQKKTALRLELLRTKELSKQMKEQLKEKVLQKKERRRENIKRAEENKRKAEIVQVITNTAKLRRMKKKQLRFIEKRDTNKAVEASK